MSIINECDDTIQCTYSIACCLSLGSGIYEGQI